jgi:predicted  nucleic acid-binding Zn-ribbon protein
MVVMTKKDEAQATLPSLSSAETAYIQMKLDLSRKILERVLVADNTVVEDKVKAEQQLALQDWKFHKDYNSAILRLHHADFLEVKCSTWQVRSRIEREVGHYDEAQSAARKALELAESESDKVESTILLSDAIYNQNIQELLEGKKLHNRLLDEANHVLDDILDREPGHPKASKLLLGISLLRQDGPSVLKAWRYYFHIPLQQDAQGLLSEPCKTLDALLPDWKGCVLSQDKVEKLVLALAQSRFFECASIAFAIMQRGTDHRIRVTPAIQEILLYEKFISNVKRLTEEYYRQIALGNKQEKAYKQSLKNECFHLWQQLHFEGEKPKFDEKVFVEEIGRRFGAEIRLGPSGNYDGLVLFMGHRVIDETRVIEQYGYRAELRFISLDSIVSNCYSGWFWDGRQMPGGWGTESTIVQIREAYLGESFWAWGMVSDPQKRSETEKSIEQESAMDDLLARENPYAYLPGLQRRLFYNSTRHLYDALRAQGYEGPELCIAFVAEFLRLKVESSIFAHEGRHAIDQLYYHKEFFKKWRMEVRAKLSQFVFTADPKLSVSSGGIFDRNIGSKSSHGKANEQIMKIIVKWMNEHSKEIPELDVTRPLLPQFDLLNCEQVQAIGLEADPLMKKNS